MRYSDSRVENSRVTISKNSRNWCIYQDVLREERCKQTGCLDEDLHVRCTLP